MRKVILMSQLLCGITLLALFSARLTSILAKYEQEPLAKEIKDVHHNKLNLYIHGGSCFA